MLCCRQGFLALVFSLLSLLPMSAFLYMELCTIAAYGWGWLRAWNVLDMVRADLGHGSATARTRLTAAGHSSNAAVGCQGVVRACA